MELSTTFLAVLVPVALVAGVIRGFAGFGGPLVMLPALNIFMPPAAAVQLMMWIDLVVNVRLVPEVARQAQSAILVPLIGGAFLTLPLGVLALVAVDADLMKRCVSAAILVAALILLSGWRYPGGITRPGWVGIGLLAGVVMGATSLAVTAALFLQAGSQSARENRANFIIWVFVITIVMLGMLAAGTGFDRALLPAFGMLAPPYVIGTLAGAYLTGRLPDAQVRRAVLLLVIAVAATTLVL
jgi:uncharacterized membrane protein YfcA